MPPLETLPVDLLVDARARVGECPVWAPAEGALYWVDALAPALHRVELATGVRRSWATPAPIGSFALREGGGLLVALQDGFHFFDPATGAFTLVVDPEPDSPANRLNDGRCDREGRFWCGSMRSGSAGLHGRLHRLDANGSVATHLDGLGTSNGLSFSPDGRTMYLSDSHPSVRAIWRFDYDRETGTPRNRQPFGDLWGVAGRPDGAAVDVEGCYWSAMADGWQVVRFTPDGRVDRRIAMPMAKPSMPAFGGPDLRTLFVTSLNPDQIFDPAQPHAGGVFALNPGVAGLEEPRFAG